MAFGAYNNELPSRTQDAEKVVYYMQELGLTSYDFGLITFKINGNGLLIEKDY